MGFKRRPQADTRTLVVGHLERFLAGVLRLGGEGELRVEPAMSLEKLRTDHPKLPPGATELFTTVVGALSFEWSFNDEAADRLVDKLGDDFEESRFGGFDLDPTCFEYVDIDTWAVDDETWRDKVLFAPDGSGDYLGVDIGASPGEVIFLGHDLDPDTHGVRIAANLVDMLVRWAPLGCVGPDAVAWLPFVGKNGRYIDPTCANAKMFIDYVVGSAGKGNWKSAKKDKYTKLVTRMDAIVADPRRSFETMTKTITAGGYGKKLPKRFSKALVAELGSWFGTDVAPELSALLTAMSTGEPGGELGELKTRIPSRLAMSCDNAFVQALTDRLLLDGAMSNMCPIGGAQPWDSYFVEVGDGTAVFTSRPSDPVKYRANSLPHFAQLLRVAHAFANVKWRQWTPGDDHYTHAVEVFSALAPHLSCHPHQEKNLLDDFIAAFQGEPRAGVSHPVLTRLEQSRVLRANLRGDTSTLPTPPSQPAPGDLSTIVCADALYWLTSAFLTAPVSDLDERIAAAGQHRARLVRDAATLVAALVEGVDDRHPGKHLWDLRQLCHGGTREQPRTDTAALKKLVASATDETERAYAQATRDAKTASEIRLGWHNFAYHYSRSGEWAKLVPVSSAVIESDPSDGWRYRGIALAGLGRHDKALDAFNHSLLYPSTSRSDAYELRLLSVAGAGDKPSARAHLDWLTPTVRARHTDL
jgi:hypothetical protein